MSRHHSLRFCAGDTIQFVVFDKDDKAQQSVRGQVVNDGSLLLDVSGRITVLAEDVVALQPKGK